MKKCTLKANSVLFCTNQRFGCLRWCPWLFCPFACHPILEGKRVILLGVVGLPPSLMAMMFALSGEMEGLPWSILAVMPVGLLPLL